jgi:hypothetical protein
MRARMLVLVVLVSTACSKEPGSPDTDGAEAGETSTGHGESESDTSTTEDSTSESAGSETGDTETGEPVDCPSLGEVECSMTPGCYPVSGISISADLSCREAGRFAVCSSSEFCSEAEIGYRDPEGGCWWFYADCIHGEAGWESSSEQCPDYEEFYMLPECG